MRVVLLQLVVIFLCFYAWKDWYKSLCALIAMMAVIGHESMPRAMFGITGMNPWNILLLSTLLAWMVAKKKEGLVWDMPKNINRLLLFYFVVSTIALVRFILDMEGSLYLAAFLNNELPSPKRVIIDNFLNAIKWVMPGILVFYGCTSEKRIKLTLISMVLMYLVLGILTIKWMPVGLLVDADALQRRAIRVLNREIGYYRTNLSIILAAGAWILFSVRSLYDKKYNILFLLGAAVVSLGMALTGGRAGYLAWLAIGVILFITNLKKYILILPVFLLILALFIPQAVMDRFYTGLSDSEDGGGSSSFDMEAMSESEEVDTLSAGRMNAWPLVIDKILERPVFGYGYDSMRNTGLTLILYENLNVEMSHPHNAYLQLTLDTGFFGAIPIIILYLIMLKYSWELYRDKSQIKYIVVGSVGIAILISFLLGSLTGQSFYPSERAVPIWCTIGLLLRVYVDRTRNTHKENREDELLNDTRRAGVAVNNRKIRQSF